MENIKLFDDFFNFSNASKNEGRNENLKIKEALKRVKNILKILKYKYTLDGNTINVFKNSEKILSIIFNRSRILLEDDVNNTTASEKTPEQISYHYDDIDNFVKFLQKKLKN